MPFAQVNGQNLYFEDSGGNGPAIVFSHGLLMDSSMFAPQVAALKSRYRCITWDERGHGQTAGAECAPFSYYDSANDLAALLAHLGVKQAVLAGMSQGGYLSLRCALTHPDIVRALVLIDTQAMPEDPALMPGHQALVEDWVTNGLSDQTAAIIEHIILVTNGPVRPHGTPSGGTSPCPTCCSVSPHWAAATTSATKFSRSLYPRWWCMATATTPSPCRADRPWPRRFPTPSWP